MPTIRVDADVYKWLQSLGKPFEDNPNSVLRRVARLEETRSIPIPADSDLGTRVDGSRRNPAARRLSGRQLSATWKVDVQHALYHQDGMFYENLKRFPGALFDPNGYVLFRTEEEFRSSPYLRIGRKLNVPGGISSIPSYRRMV